MDGITVAILTPFELVQAVLQMQKYHDTYQNTFNAVLQLKQERGLKVIYRGFTGIVIRNHYT